MYAEFVQQGDICAGLFLDDVGAKNRRVAFLAPAITSPAAQVIDGLAATVNGKVITISQVRQAISVRVQVEKMGNIYSREQFDRLIATIESPSDW